MKKTKKNKRYKLERRIYRAFIFTTTLLVIGIIYTQAYLGKINLEVQELNDSISESTDSNQSLAMKINEMVSLDKIQRVSSELGLTYNNDNIKSITDE